VRPHGLRPFAWRIIWAWARPAQRSCRRRFKRLVRGEWIVDRVVRHRRGADDRQAVEDSEREGGER